ncbi:TetR family transcriptional regulator [[Brevibacterium] flavum]|uniref:TetR family transcriptional regulator n=1 Tax=[Brevibacterium] flavum TaxID=92706 RepID=A0A0F6Z7C7_9CORY|nr:MULTISPECIES: TetR/AcrR family transcriptional regulator [Corynebacterium]AKF28337.1 TetR family transcriptional regulator [[Brevibacterium] flavum]KEI24110.1 TetR family transcriptional regulator [Corynebacterium glutamicum ATCC 14067]OKX96417.1 TetR family transcriptional regulator [Corynebacterium glutamicum]QJS16724.1 TetR/AcrR family transcriptional regulator [Corynebacterium glutamicum]QXU45253.1 TetR/AcrR family transcriptional regulator [[Brevibacterium] flavum]
MSRTIDKEARKAQLAEAVWQVILDEGIGAVSVRTVAERAGVVVGSLRHIFPTRAELVVFSAELMVKRATERLLAIEPDDDVREYVFTIVKQLLPLGPDSRAEFEINLALFAEGTAVKGLVDIRQDANRQLADLFVRLVEMVTGERDTPESLQQSRRLHAMVDGFAFHILHQPEMEDTSWALDILWAEINSLAAQQA